MSEQDIQEISTELTATDEETRRMTLRLLPWFLRLMNDEEFNADYNAHIPEGQSAPSREDIISITTKWAERRGIS